MGEADAIRRQPLSFFAREENLAGGTVTDIPSPKVDQPLTKERDDVKLVPKEYISKGPELRLEAKRFATSDVDMEEKRKGRVTDRWLRVWMATGLVSAFMLWNWMVIDIVQSAAETDVQMIREKLIDPAYRTVTEKVYMALIAATAAQVGTLLVVITRYLFRAPTASRLRAKSRQDR